MNARALIVGTETDSHVKAVVDRLASLGAPAPLVLDAPTAKTLGFSVDLSRVSINGDSCTYNSGRGWLRRYAPSAWGIGVASGSEEAVSKRAFLSLIGSISRLGTREWLTELSDLLHAEDRLVQLEAAKALGVATPDTLVTSDAKEAVARFGDSFVVKPLSGGYFISPDGEPRAVFATTITRTEAAELDFASAPFVAQAVIRAHRHLRVVTVKDRVWAAELDAEPFPLDWREAEFAHSLWRPARDTRVEKLALRLARELRVGYSSQDWLLPEGDPVFLDLNPGGQWLFLPEMVRGEITTAISRFLMGE